MACFLVPTTEAIVTTVISKVAKSKEVKHEDKGVDYETSGSLKEMKTSWSKKLSWLSNMLWGGSVLLAFEHVWHGEVTPWFPFLTAAADPTETVVMLHEMSTVGAAMAFLVTIIWVGMVAVSDIIEKQDYKTRITTK